MRAGRGHAPIVAVAVSLHGPKPMADVGWRISDVPDRCRMFDGGCKPASTHPNLLTPDIPLPTSDVDPDGGWRMYGNDRGRYHLDAMDQDAMKTRTKAFALRVIKLTESLPATRAAEVIGRQLLRSATSVGAE